MVRRESTKVKIRPLKNGVSQLDHEKAEVFNGQFTDVFDKKDHSQVLFQDRYTPLMDTICVSKERVTKFLKNLGLGELHPRVLT